MKKWNITIASAVLLGIGIFSYLKFTGPTPPTNMVVSSAKLASTYNDADSMEKDSPLIVIGEKISSKTDLAYDEAGELDRYGTVSEFKVKKVVKNNTGKDIKDTISVLENAAFDTKSNRLFSAEGYQLMKENKRYILFLEENKSTRGPYVGSFEIKGVVYGKFAFDKDKEKRDALDKTETSAYEGNILKDHNKLKDEVAVKYDKVNNEISE